MSTEENPRFFHALFAEALFDENKLDRMLALGVNPDDWPNCPAKTAMRQLIDLRTSNGHAYALWKLQGNIQAMDLTETGQSFQLPTDDRALKTEYAIQRRIQVSRELSVALGKADAGDVEDVIAQFSQRLAKDGETVVMSQALDRVLDQYEAEVKAGKSMIVVPKFPVLSEAIGGFNPARVGICIAESGYGKSLLGINLAMAALERFSVLYVNMEMSLRDMTERFAAIATNRPFFHIRNHGNIDREMVREMLKGPADQELLMTSGADMSVEEIASQARLMKFRHKIGMIVVDYDQKITLKLDRNTQEWKALQLAIGSLEDLCKEIDVYGLLMSQANEEGGISGSKRMRFAASNVWHFHEHEDFGSCIQLTKVRHGERGTIIRLNYDPVRGKISEFVGTEADPNPVKAAKIKKKGRL